MLFAGTIYGFGLLWLDIRRVALRFRDLAEHVSQCRFVQVLVFAPLFLLTMDVLCAVALALRASARTHLRAVGSREFLRVWDWTKGELHRDRDATHLLEMACCDAAPRGGGSTAGWG
ncbi:MAG: hypothetical protein U0P30_00080 [Vicinamibacterales bacterium]